MVKRTSCIEKIRPYSGIDHIKVISGMLRCGKSVIVEQLRDEITTSIDPICQRHGWYDIHFGCTCPGCWAPKFGF